MRYLFGFLCVCALGVVPLVGCSEEEPECRTDEDCDDQNECTDDVCIVDSALCVFEAFPWEGEVCNDGDHNECAYGRCDDGVCTPGTGYSYYVDDGTPCESYSIPGVCLCGRCKVEPECSTDEDCDDGIECTDDFCDRCGSCHSNTGYPECDPCERNGVPGVCIDGVCEEAPECSTDEDCDDGIECTDDVCDDCYGCQNLVNCYDGDPCTEDRCDPDTGCFYPTSPDGTDCGCLAEGPCDDLICRIIWCPPCCTHYGYCQNGECV